MSRNISIKIKEKAYELGYDLCGIIEAKVFAEYMESLDMRVEKYPKSAHLYKNLYNLANPFDNAAWGKSIIVCVRRYNKYKIPQGLDKYFGKIFLADGRLSFTQEYSNFVQFEYYLKEQGMKTYHDGVPARLAAVKAGLGHLGRSNFLYTKFGSWVWIDTWIVDFQLEYDSETENPTPCPENCRRCVQACPTKALSAAYTMDRGTCIAHISFNSTDLPLADTRDKMGTLVYGCDICQDVCPKNKNKWIEDEAFPQLDDITNLLSLEKIFSMDEVALSQILHPRFWYISKDRLWLWRCNAIRAMVNSGDTKYYMLIKDACSDYDERVRTIAAQAREKLGI